MKTLKNGRFRCTGALNNVGSNPTGSATKTLQVLGLRGFFYFPYMVSCMTFEKTSTFFKKGADIFLIIVYTISINEGGNQNENSRRTYQRGNGSISGQQN